MPSADNHPDRAEWRRFVGPGAVGAALAYVHGFCDDHALDADLRARLAIVVEELVLNIVEHGGHPEEEAILLGLAIDPGGVRVAIEDRGTPFDPRAAVQAEVPPDRGGGAGIALMLAWSEVIAYSSAGGRNRLELVVRAA